MGWGGLQSKTSCIEMEMIGEHPDGTSCFHSFTFELASLTAIRGVCNVEVTTHCRLTFHDKEVESFLTWTIESVLHLSSWSCSDHHREMVCGVRWCLLLLVASLLCLGVNSDKETVRRVGVLPPAPTQPHHFSTRFKRKIIKKKQGGKKKEKKKVVISVDGETMPIHHQLAAHERAHNLGVNILRNGSIYWRGGLGRRC